jgi:hypothetical protein
LIRIAPLFKESYTHVKISERRCAMQINRNLKIKTLLALLILALIIQLANSSALASLSQNRLDLTFTVSMDKPHTHYYHVNLEIVGQTSEYLDLKLPNWTPGYYRIMDYARHVINFRAKVAGGQVPGLVKNSQECLEDKNGQSQKYFY